MLLSHHHFSVIANIVYSLFSLFIQLCMMADPAGCRTSMR